MTTYLVVAAASALLSFVLASVGWSNGVGCWERTKEIGWTLAGSLTVGLFWPLVLVAAVVLRLAVSP